MNIFEKLLEIQCSVDAFVKDGQNTSDKYKYVSSDAVLDVIRPKMNELKLLLVPKTTAARVHEGTAKSGTTRYLTEIEKLFVWVDVECEEKEWKFYEVPFYAQGVDLAGEKGVGKAETYAEKYFLLKMFHVPTSGDDPDGDARTNSGEKRQRGTQAAKETVEFHRKAITQLLNELCASDGETIKTSIRTLTKSDSRGYKGVDNVGSIHESLLPAVYSKLKSKYEEKFNKDFKLLKTDEAAP